MVPKIITVNKPKTNLLPIDFDSNHCPPKNIFPKGALLKNNKKKLTIPKI
jgi:hypothetical protein